MSKKRKMVRGVALIASQLNNLRVYDPHRRGDKNIVKLEAEEMPAKPMIGRRISISWISYPEGVHQGNRI
jgi:hypothetical protein